MTKTALIVEDEIFIALDLERILTDAGYNVAGIAPDSASAYGLADDCDFAFVDVNLRDGATGPEVAARLTNDFDLRVVFVTANPDQIESADAALGYVQKPFCERSIANAAAFATGKATAEPSGTDIVLFPRQRG